MNIPKSIKSNMVFAKNKNPKVQFNLQFSWIPQSNRSSFSKKFYLFYKKKKKIYFFYFTSSLLQNTHINPSIL